MIGWLLFAGVLYLGVRVFALAFGWWISEIKNTWR